MSLLSGQSALVFYALFVWIMPITLILLYCARYNQEQKGHLQYIYISKMGRRKYFLSKINCSFIVSAVYSAIPLLLNLFVSVLFLHGGTTFADVENWNVGDFGLGGEFSYYCIHHPYVAWFMYFTIAILVFGLVGIMSQCIAIISKDNKITLAASFAIWISLFSIKYDLTMAIQPFTEYGYIYGVKALVIFMIFVIASFVGACVSLVVRKDEV